jgi:hypothetical protein
VISLKVVDFAIEHKKIHIEIFKQSIECNRCKLAELIALRNRIAFEDNIVNLCLTGK